MTIYSSSDNSIFLGLSGALCTAHHTAAGSAGRDESGKAVIDARWAPQMAPELDTFEWDASNMGNWAQPTTPSIQESGCIPRLYGAATSTHDAATSTHDAATSNHDAATSNIYSEIRIASESDISSKLEAETSTLDNLHRSTAGSSFPRTFDSATSTFGMQGWACSIHETQMKPVAAAIRLSVQSTGDTRLDNPERTVEETHGRIEQVERQLGEVILQVIKKSIHSLVRDIFEWRL